MALLGVIAPNFAIRTAKGLIGANFASIYATNALIASGRFDAVHLYASNAAQLAALEQAIAEHAWPVRVTAHLDLTLRERVAAEPYDLFYVPAISPVLADLARLRAEVGAHYRLLATTSTISYPAFEEVLAELLVAPLDARDAIAVCSHATRDVLRRLIAAAGARVGRHASFRLPVVPYGVDTARYAPGDRKASRARLGLREQERYVLSLARFSVVDKFDYGPLLDMFQAAQFGPEWRLVLAGGAEPAHYLEFVKLQAQLRGLGDRVVFAPNLDERLKPDLYNACDVFVSPSDNVQESFGLTLVEAMACGLPVVASDWNGYKDLVVDGETGFRVPTFFPALDLLRYRTLHDNAVQHLLVAQSTAVSVPDGAHALSRLADAGLRERLGAAGRRRALSEFSQAAVAAALLADTAEPAEIGPFATPASLWQLFAGYGTRALAPGDRLIATPRAFAPTETLGLYRTPELEVLLVPALLDLLGLACQNGARYESLLEAYAPEWGAERVVYALHHLLKQDLLRLA